MNDVDVGELKRSRDRRQQEPRQANKGRQADKPSDIPKHGWWEILLRVKDRISRDNISIIAAGAAFYAFMAIPSILVALVTVYGLISDPAQIEQQVSSLQGVIPGDVASMLTTQLQTLASTSSSTLSVGLIIAVLVALWGARSGMSTLMTALNIAYGEEEKRSFIRFQAGALLLTAGAIVFLIVAIALIGVLPAVIGFLPLGEFGKTLASILRWPILLVIVLIGLAALYRYAPCRAEPRWRWVSRGAVAATMLWIAGSALFSVYVTQFAGYNKTYGAAGAIVVVQMWLYLTMFAVLLGAELNAEIEHQTARDTTTGRPRPMGERGARMADTVADPG